MGIEDTFYREFTDFELAEFEIDDNNCIYSFSIPVKSVGSARFIFVDDAWEWYLYKQNGEEITSGFNLTTFAAMLDCFTEAYGYRPGSNPDIFEFCDLRYWETMIFGGIPEFYRNIEGSNDVSYRLAVRKNSQGEWQDEVMEGWQTHCGEYGYPGAYRAFAKVYEQAEEFGLV